MQRAPDPQGHPTPRPPRPGPLLLLGLAVAVSCGKDAGEQPAASAGTALPAGVESRTGIASGVLFEERVMPKSPVMATYEPLIDPVVAGWTSESRVQAAEPALREFFRALYFGDPQREDRLGFWLAADFIGSSELRPSDLATLAESAALRIEVAGKLGEELHAAEQVGSLARAPAEIFAGAEGARLELEITGFDGQAPDGPRLSARVRASARVDKLARQVNSAWELDLGQPGVAGGTNLRRLRLLAHEELRASAPPWMIERTGEVLDEVWFYNEQFLTGLDTLFGKQDSRTGNDLLGFNGLAVGDVDGDGLEDVYVCQPGGTPNRLLLQQEDGSVIDQTLEKRVAWLDPTRAALFLDLDNDGDQDLAVAILSDVMIGMNDGSGAMSWDRVQGDGEAEIWSLSAADADLDGDLDLYACRFAGNSWFGRIPTPYHDANTGFPNLFLRNDGKGKLAPATEDVGLSYNNNKYSLSALWEDFDADGDPDLYVSNHYGRNTYYRNDRGTFREIGYELGLDRIGSGSAALRADFDLDGMQDLFLAAWGSVAGARISSQRDRFMAGRFVDYHAFYGQHARGSALMRRDGEGYAAVPDAMGASGTGATWGAALIDFDRDGREDLFLPCGMLSAPRPEAGAAQGGASGAVDLESFYWREVVSSSPPEADVESDYPEGMQPENPLRDAYESAWKAMTQLLVSGQYDWSGGQLSRAFVNVGGRFVDASACVGADLPGDARAVAELDWDGDGRLDLLVKSRTAPRLRFLHNESGGENHWLGVELQGRTCNRDAIGARVQVELSDRRLEKSVHAGGGFLAQSSKRLHFGLGAEEQVKSLRVFWPGGGTAEFTDVPADGLLRIRQGDSDFQRDTRVAPAIDQRQVAMPQEPSRQVNRFAPVHKLPLGALGLPAYDDDQRKVADLQGRPALVILWSLDVPASRAALERLAEHPELSAGGGVQCVPMSIDGPARRAEARQFLASLSLDSNAGEADQALLLALEVLFVNLRGTSKDMDLPVTLLLDQAGQMVATYLGRLGLPRVRHDLQILGMIDPKGLSNSDLLGGQWLYRLPRDYSRLVAQFSGLGRTDLAAFFGSLPSQ